MSDSVSSNDVIDGLREKVGDLVYENSILRAQVITARRRIEELERQNAELQKKEQS